MNNFLVEIGLSDNIINELVTDENLMFKLYSNKKEVINICNYLKSINIEDIGEILLYKPNLFLENVQSIKYYFKKFDLNDIVTLINEDYTNVDLLY